MMREKTQLFLIQNHGTEPLTVVLEPLAREIVLQPGEIAHAFDVTGEDDCPAEIVRADGRITVWLNFEGYLLHNGQITPNHPYDSDATENIRMLKSTRRT